MCGLGLGFRDEEFEEEEGGGEDEHEEVAGDVVAAEPMAAVGFAGKVGGDGRQVDAFGWNIGFIEVGYAAAAGGGEAAVDEGRTEEPLRCHYPG